MGNSAGCARAVRSPFDSAPAWRVRSRRSHPPSRSGEGRAKVVSGLGVRQGHKKTLHRTAQQQFQQSVIGGLFLSLQPILAAFDANHLESLAGLDVVFATK